MSNSKNSERLAAQYKADKPVFEAALNKVLTDYGLAQKLAQAKASGHKLRILNYRCGEGLYLHLFSEFLESRGLVEGAELYGVDWDPAVIATADEYQKFSTPPRPNLRFFVHDLALPLAEGYNLNPLRDKEGQVRFDFIFAQRALTYGPHARQVLERLYNHNLKLGGMLYLRDVAVSQEGPQGWYAPHPALQVLGAAIIKIIASSNPGIEVTEATSKWLEELGAYQIQAIKDLMPWAGAANAGGILCEVYSCQP